MARKKTDPGPRIDEALLELAQDFRGSVLSREVSDRIARRILEKKASKPVKGAKRGRRSG